MEKKKKELDVKKLKTDIRNAELYFTKTGEDAKNAYKALEEEITENDVVTQTIFLYIPGTIKDIYEIFKN